MNSYDLLPQFEGLRVADIRDGLDVMGYHHYATLSPGFRPLWRSTAIGVARTARYLPYQGRIPELDPEPYAKWSGRYYGETCTYPWVKEIQKGDFMAIDCSGVDAGLIGSENSLACLKNGAVGFVSDGGIRDTDEVILQKVPFWTCRISQKMVQGRLEFSDTGQPIALGGVQVRQGDIIAADGDGVIVVPQAIAAAVAEHAQAENQRDRANRRRHYADLGRQPDDTVA